ncbi:hypothetical protein AK812_SmicGene27996 [Symbiodinium microadriaticum]|uniref:Uncharacterized protein n=1 Tax=Symbiodinium microadriaticum TaxID=2951 RepID=A0A1Q9D5H7_SYMMI|nr:hypothetical protein AK812_SmicGene27996 [Symbiodinium microadriaticum]
MPLKPRQHQITSADTWARLARASEDIVFAASRVARKSDIGGQPTAGTETELDYVLVHADLASHLTLSLDWNDNMPSLTAVTDDFDPIQKEQRLSIAKLATHTAITSQLGVDHADLWLGDISVDVSHPDPEIAASLALAASRKLEALFMMNI